MFTAPIPFDLEPHATATVSSSLPYAARLADVTAADSADWSRFDIMKARLAREIPALARFAPSPLIDLAPLLQVSSFKIADLEQLLLAGKHIPFEFFVQCIKSTQWRLEPEQQISLTITNSTDKPLRGAIVLHGYTEVDYRSPLNQDR